MSTQADGTVRPDEVVIVFKPLPCEVAPEIRVRQLRRTALRRDRLKAVRVVLRDAPSDKPTPAPSVGADAAPE
jgi:hypothetical protein